MIERRALIIDDNDIDRTWLASALRDRSWEVIATRSGRLAIEVAQQQQPDVVISELTLPDVNGLQLARALRTVVENDLRVIGLTRLPRHIRQQATACGYDHALPKPVDILDLFSAMFAAPRTLFIDPKMYARVARRA